MYRFTPVAPGVHTFSAYDGDVTATLTRTYAARYRLGTFPESAWKWEVRICGGIVDSGQFHSGGMAVAREAACLTLNHLTPMFEWVSE